MNNLHPYTPHQSNTLPVFVGLFVATVLTRLPFLHASSVGADPDAWRVALAARHLTTTGDYVASRFPSYPVHEIGSALGWLGGWGGMNGLTVVFSGVAAGFFGLVLRRLGVRAYSLGALALAFTPVVYVNSVVTMDYVWSLAFMLGGFYYALCNRPRLAGGWMGLAIGARLTAAAMVLPLGWLLWTHETKQDGAGGRGNQHGLAVFAAFALAVAAAWYLAPLFAYGPGFLRFYDGALPLHIALHRATLDVWGEIGFVAVVAAVGWVIVRRRPLPGGMRRVEQALLGGVALYLLAYVRLPLESGYLMPVVPLVLAWLGLRLPHRGFVALCLALLVSPFFLDLEADTSLPRDAMEPALPVDIGSTRMRLLLLGPLFTERVRIASETDTLRALAAAVRDLPRPAVLLADGLWAKLDVTLDEAGDGLVIVPSLDRLWDERADDPLSRLWPPTDSTRRWPLYVLPGVEAPRSDDPRLHGRRPHRVVYATAPSKRPSTSSASG